MQDNKIIIKVPNELKADLSNTKALDWKEENQERFFESNNFELYPDQTSLYFDLYRILYFQYISENLSLFWLFWENKFKFIQIKNKILKLKEYWQNNFEEFLDLLLNINSDKKLNDFDKLDYFYYFVYKFDEIKFPKVFFYRYLKDFEFDNFEDLLYFFWKNEKVDKFFFDKYIETNYKNVDIKNIISNFLKVRNYKTYAILKILILIVKKYWDINYIKELEINFEKLVSIESDIFDDSYTNEIRESIFSLLLLIVWKDTDYIKKLFSKNNFKENFLNEKILDIFKVLSEKDFNFVKSYIDETKIESILNPKIELKPVEMIDIFEDDIIEKNRKWILEFLKIIWKYDIAYIQEIYYKNNNDIWLLEIIWKYNTNFVIEEFEKNYILDEITIWKLTDNDFNLLFIISKNDFNYLAIKFPLEKIKCILNQDKKNNINIINSLKLLYYIWKNDFKKIYWFKKELEKYIIHDDIRVKSWVYNILYLSWKNDKKFFFSFLWYFKDYFSILLWTLNWESVVIKFLEKLWKIDIKLLKKFDKEIKIILEKINNPEDITLFFSVLRFYYNKDRSFLKKYRNELWKLFYDEKSFNYYDNLFIFYENIYKKNKKHFFSIFDKKELYKYFDFRYSNSQELVKLLKYFLKFDLKFVESFLKIDSPFIISHQKQEIQNFIENYNSWSCLVSWYRWIWKTSLINSCIEEYKENEKEKNIIPIHINIPETDEKWKLDKKEIINRIIVKIFEKIDKNKDIPRKLKKEFFEHYLRVYNEVENKQTITKEYEKGFKFEIKEILTLTIFIVISVFISLQIWWFFIDNFKNIFSDFYKILWITSIFWLISSSLFLSYKENNKKEKIIKELYTPDIIEGKITKSISCFNKWFTFDNFMKKIKEVLTLEIKKKHIKKFFNFLNPLRFLFYKPTKFIFVIDELDKLLDFEKVIENRKNSTITMKQVFEVLGKLKTLFFDTNWAIFFVVTNKQAYDYYLQNKHQEDDLVSNIFNKIVYLPMNEKENFNLNFQIEVQEDSQKEENKIKHLREKLKNYIYFKSHWNWRKARFELSNMLKWNEIILDKENFELEYKFYDFFDKLYNVLNKWFLNHTSQEFKSWFSNLIIGWNANLLDDFLFWFNKWYIDKLYNTKEQKEKWFYLDYLKWVNSLILSKNGDKKDLLVLNFLEKFIQDFESDENFKKEYFWYVIWSINKLSEEAAYRDFVLNYLLNIFENIKFIRKTNFKEVFESIQLNPEDYKNLAFTELILYWLPLFLFYFYNTEYHG